MSNQVTTSWVLNLVDKVTKPIKTISQATSSLTNSIDAITDSYKFNSKEIKEALNNSKAYYNETNNEVKKLETELNSLKRAYENAQPGRSKAEAKQAFEQASVKVEEYKRRLQEAKTDVEQLTKEVNEFKNSNNSGSWMNAFTGINQGIELVQKAVDSLNFTTAIINFQNDTQRITDLTGDRLKEFVKDAQITADIYGASSLDIVKSANALTKQVGGTYEENLKYIEEGFKKGANINGDFLDQLHEYAPKIKDTGLTISEAIGMIASAGKDGVWNDKAIDSIKEADQSLKEMGQSQKDALAGIGIDYRSLEGLTSKEAIQKIAKQMQTASTSAKQLVLADIFKGAGEDAGLSIVEGFANGFTDLSTLPEVEQSASKITAIFSGVKTWIAQNIGDVGIYAQTLAPILLSVSSAIPIFKALTSATFYQTAATKLLTVAQTIQNAVFNMSPVGKIILGVTALAGVVAYAWNKFEGFRTIVFKSWEGLKLFGSIIKDYVIDRVKGMLSGISGLAQMISQLFSGEFEKAFETGKKATSDLLGITAGKKAGEGFKNGWNDAMNKGQLKSDEYTKNKNSTTAETKPSVNNYAKGNPTTLGGFKDSEGKKTGGTSSNKDSLNVGSGSNGIKSIQQTLNITNVFNVDKGTDVRKIADQVVSYINDGLRDSVINIG